MLETISDLAAVVGWPKLLLAGLVILINLAPRDRWWRAGSALLALAIAASLVYLDWSEKQRIYGEARDLRQYARTAVIEQRVDKIEATKTKRIIDAMARGLLADDPQAVTLHDSAIAYDMTLGDAYVDQFLKLASPDDSPALAARWSLSVFNDRMNAELPQTGDNVLYFLSKEYERVFRKLKDVDPSACPAFMNGKSLLSSNALSDVYGAIGIAFRTMPDKTRPVSKGTRADAMAFGERVLGRERLATLMARTQSSPDTCDSLASIYAAITADSSPAAFAASRYWLQPYRLVVR